MYSSRLAAYTAVLCGGIFFRPFVPLAPFVAPPQPSEIKRGAPRVYRKTTTFGDHCGGRQCGRYARQDAHELQRRSHKSPTAAMNPHLRAHLFGDGQ